MNTAYFSYQVSAIEAKVEHEEAEFDNMEVINEKQENNKNVGINEDANARCVIEISLISCQIQKKNIQSIFYQRDVAQLSLCKEII